MFISLHPIVYQGGKIFEKPSICFSNPEIEFIIKGLLTCIEMFLNVNGMKISFNVSAVFYTYIDDPKLITVNFQTQK